MKREGANQRRSNRPGFTLVEVLITVAVLAVLAGMLVPYVNSTLPEQLHAGAQVAAADIEYARNLAIHNNSKYRITFQPSANNYYLEHSGTNANLQTLPKSPYKLASDPASRQTTDLSKLPLGDTKLTLIVAQLEGTGATTTTLEFGPLGGTTATAATNIWFACGQGASRRYLPLRVDPITGIAEAGTLTATSPLSVGAAGS